MPGAAIFNNYGPNAAAQGLAQAQAFNTPPGGNAYGSVPEAVSPQASQNTAIGGNLANINQLYQLATGIGGASGAGAMAGLNAALPGAGSGLESALGVAKTDLTGQVPQDVINLLQQQGAERGIATGTGGSGDSNAAYMQALGLTSLGQQQTGIQDLSSVIGATPQGPAFNPASMLVTPGEQLGQANYNATLASAPDPRSAALTNLAALNAGRGASGGGGRMPAGLPDPTGISSNSMASNIYGPLGGFTPATGGAGALTQGNMYGSSGGGQDANGLLPGQPGYDARTDPSSPAYKGNDTYGAGFGSPQSAAFLPSGGNLQSVYDTQGQAGAFSPYD